MVTLRIEVLMQKDHKLGDNEFVKGKISGMFECICRTEEKHRYALRNFSFGTVFTAKATAEEYVELKSMIEECYVRSFTI